MKYSANSKSIGSSISIPLTLSTITALTRPSHILLFSRINVGVVTYAVAVISYTVGAS